VVHEEPSADHDADGEPIITKILHLPKSPDLKDFNVNQVIHEEALGHHDADQRPTTDNLDNGKKLLRGGMAERASSFLLAPALNSRLVIPVEHNTDCR
jgi:hypothetical protein